MEDLQEKRLSKLKQVLAGRAFTLCIDETGDRKKGKTTDYMASQYIGNIGKLANGIVSVNAYGVLDQITFPLLFKVYKPHTRLKPEDTYKTKPELAVEIIEELENWGFQFEVVLADCVYGESSTFINALEKRHLKYVLAIRSNHGAWLPAGSRIRQLSWRPFDRVFSNGEKQTRYIREIIFGWRGPVRFYLITIDPRTLPKDGIWFIMTNLEGKIHKAVGNTYGFRTWIEYGFKQSKNELGWADYRVTDYASIEHWWELVFCAYTLVSWKSPCLADQRTGRCSCCSSSSRGRSVSRTSLVGYRAWLEERPQQFAAHPPAVCFRVFTLSLDAAFRSPLLTHRVGTTYRHHEPFPCSPPDLTEEGLGHTGGSPVLILLHDDNPSSHLAMQQE